MKDSPGSICWQVCTRRRHGSYAWRSSGLALLCIARDRTGISMEVDPGVEVLANAVNTILRGRFYRETPDWLATLLCGVDGGDDDCRPRVSQGRSSAQTTRFPGWVSRRYSRSFLLVFTHWLVIPPTVPALISLAVAAPCCCSIECL